jgi:hypothetical protein
MCPIYSRKRAPVFALFIGNFPPRLALKLPNEFREFSFFHGAWKSAVASADPASKKRLRRGAGAGDVPSRQSRSDWRGTCPKALIELAFFAQIR